MTGIGHPNWIHIRGEGGRTFRVESGANRNIDPTYLFGSYIHDKLILYRFGTIHICYTEMNRRTPWSYQYQGNMLLAFRPIFIIILRHDAVIAKKMATDNSSIQLQQHCHATADLFDGVARN